MRKLSLMLIAMAAVLSLTAIPALADQLALGSEGSVYFCNIGGEIFLSTTAGCVPAGGTIDANTGSFESPNGTTVLSNQPWSFGLPSFGWIVSGLDLVPASTPSTNSFSWGSGVGAITGTITWNFLSDNSPSSKLAGSMVIGANSNGGMLGTDFPVGASVSIDYIFGGLNPTVGGLLRAGSGRSSIGTGSTGEVLPAVPEPGAVFLLGVGFLVVGTFLRRRGQAHVG
jgi:PEP-CTERM motif